MTFEENLRRLEPVVGREKIARAWRLYQAEDADGRRDIEMAVRFQLEKHLGVGAWESEAALSLPGPEQADGDCRLGTVMSGSRPLHPFGLREDEFIQHAAIFGRSGAGKTNTVAVLVRELVRRGKPFLIFDWKRNYRDLLAGPDPVPLEVYTVGRSVRPLRFNPLIPPPGTDLKAWLKKLIEIISHAYYLGEGVMFILQQALDHVYTQFGCYSEAGVTRYPTMQDVLAFVQEMPVKGRKAMWLDSTLRAVQSLCFGQISDVINVSSSDSIGDILTRNACLELNALAHAEKIFLIETLLVWTHHFRMLEPDRETFKHCMIIEEAHNILSASKKETVVDLLLREIRELGEGIVLVDQHPSQISVPAIGNTYCTIALNMKHTKDINALADIMQIPRDNRGLLGQLPMGRALVKLQSRFLEPFQIQIPKVDLAKGSVTDTHLRQLYPGDYADSQPESDYSVPPTDSQPVPPSRKDSEEPVEPALTNTEELLLRDIYEHPLDGVVRRYHRIGVSRRRGNRAKEGLLEKNVIRPVDVTTRTGKVVLLDFTDAMKAAMKRNGKKLPGQRHGGLVHAYWKEKLKGVFEARGWSVTVEKPIGKGQAIDLHATKNGTCVAIEVETGDRGIMNLQKLIPRNDDWILMFCSKEEVKHTTREAIETARIQTNNILLATPADYEAKIANVIDT